MKKSCLVLTVLVLFVLDTACLSLEAPFFSDEFEKQPHKVDDTQSGIETMVNKMSNPVKEDIDDASSSKSNSLESTQSEINKINSMDIERNHVLSEESSLENDLHSDYDVQPETVSKESTDDDENKSKKSLSQSNTHVESIDDTTESDKNKNDNDQEQNRDLESGSSDDSWVFARRP